MGEADQVRARRLGGHEAVRHQAARRDGRGELPVFAHREAVAVGQRGLVGRVEHDRDHGRDPVDSGDDTDTLNAPVRFSAGATARRGHRTIFPQDQQGRRKRPNPSGLSFGRLRLPFRRLML